MKRLRLVMEFDVPDAEIAKSFSHKLRARMFKYLLAHASTIYKMDTTITDIKEKK